jgi:hypothetical protein
MSLHFLQNPLATHSMNLRITLFLFLIATSLMAQQELGLSLMRHVWQSNKTNPAIVQPNVLAIEIGGLRNNLVFDGPAYNQIVTKDNGKNSIDIDRLLGHLQPENAIREDLEIPTLGVAVRIKNLTLSAGHTIKYHAFLHFPKTLPQLVWQGNAQFIGQTVDLGHELQSTGYHQLAVGAAYKIGNLTLGVKGKYLSGIADATTDDDRHSASLYTNPDVYQITLNGDYILHTANSIDYENIDEFEADFAFGNLTLDRFFTGNTGFALDLGARFEWGKLDIAASVLDIGKITWDEDVTNYSATKSYEYEGLDFSEALTGGDINFSEALDTLEQLFQVEKSYSAYTNKLPRKMYLTAAFQLTKIWTFSGVLFHENFRGTSNMAAGIGVNAALSKYINLGILYAVKENKSYDNLGLNLALKLGPFQLFGVTDNILALLKPGDSKNFSARIGGALLIK